MLNEDNLKPDERVNEIMGVANTLGAVSVISYFLNELAKNANHKGFDDQCYWKEVEEEFNSRLKYDI